MLINVVINFEHSAQNRCEIKPKKVEITEDS